MTEKQLYERLAQMDYEKYILRKKIIEMMNTRDSSKSLDELQEVKDKLQILRTYILSLSKREELLEAEFRSQTK